MSAVRKPWSSPEVLKIVEHHWGFRSFRPLQEEAMQAVVEGRDSLVVMPTGGGKSLCYQTPALYCGGTTVVISPLISLMKDQVDSLRSCGVPAIQINSSQSEEERWAYSHDIRQGEVRLVFISPERLVNTSLFQLLQKIDVRAFAIDEAHCISHWGHDFRPEYRQMSRLREWFPGVSVHAYTATATEQVRQDIVRQLQLQDPEVLIGNFDRQNLTYRVLPRVDMMKQVNEVLERHKNEAGIIYCLRRRDVDDLTQSLRAQGYNALAYHAGLSPEDRRQTQDAFASESVDVVVATVAFGMGIDRSNVRFVLHVAMPKSLEHYQQETGRAGRDGLEAECVLLFSGSDLFTWKSIIEKSAAEAREAGEEVDPTFVQSAQAHVDDMNRYCRGAVCRHKALVRYFGQDYDKPSCDACDLCLGDVTEVPDSIVIAQKILSCVARVEQRFGITHVIGVLRGESTESIRRKGHNKLSTYRLLKGTTKPTLRDWIYQLIDQQVLVQQQVAMGDRTYPILKLNAASWEVMRGEREVRLIQLVTRKKGQAPARSQVDESAWEGVDVPLFEELRGLRREIAEKRGLAPFVVFSDAVLRRLAQIRPSTKESMHLISGVGSTKLRDFGQKFLDLINTHCQDHGLSQDQQETTKRAPIKTPKTTKASFPLFAQGKSISEVAKEVNLAESTLKEHLAAFILTTKPKSISQWIDDPTYHRIAAAARKVGTERLKPIYLALGEKVPYDQIRIVLAHLQSQASE